MILKTQQESINLAKARLEKKEKRSKPSSSASSSSYSRRGMGFMNIISLFSLFFFVLKFCYNLFFNNIFSFKIHIYL